MAKKQIMFDIVEQMPKNKQYDKEKYLKQKWRNKLQKYCDEQSQTEGHRNGYCVCGYMNYCDYCSGAFKNTNCCVKAICEVAKIKNIKIDYNDFNFEKFLEKIGD